MTVGFRSPAVELAPGAGVESAVTVLLLIGGGTAVGAAPTLVEAAGGAAGEDGVEPGEEKKMLCEDPDASGMENVLAPEVAGGATATVDAEIVKEETGEPDCAQSSSSSAREVQSGRDEKGERGAPERACWACATSAALGGPPAETVQSRHCAMLFIAVFVQMLRHCVGSVWHACGGCQRRGAGT